MDIKKTDKPYTAREFKVLCVRECPVTNRIETPEQVKSFWFEHVTGAAWFVQEKEIMVTLCLNTRHKVTAFELCAIGLLDTLLVHPREIFRMAVIQNASALVLVHCHPSGDTSPSEADIKVTRDLIRAGQLLKIEVIDHVIVGAKADDKATSLREAGYFCTA